MGEIVSAYKVVLRMKGINIRKALRIVPHSYYDSNIITTLLLSLFAKVKCKLIGIDLNIDRCLHLYFCNLFYCPF